MLGRIILAFSGESAAEKLKTMLSGTSYYVEPSVCRSGAELLRRLQGYDEALVIMGFKLPDMTVNHVYEELDDNFKLISIVRPDHQEDILYDDILALPLPITRARLISSVNILLGNIPDREKEIVRNADELKIVERAKLFLIERFHMTEDQAHRFIQKRSMDTGSKLTDTAKAVLDIDD